MPHKKKLGSILRKCKALEKENGRLFMKIEQSGIAKSKKSFGKLEGLLPHSPL